MGAEPQLQISCVLCDRLTAQDPLVSNPLCRDCAIDLRRAPQVAVATARPGPKPAQGTYRKLR